MFVAKKQDATLEAQSCALYAPSTPDYATGTFRQQNHAKHLGT